jgi:DNA-binding transcriptional ArsR family regulator
MANSKRIAILDMLGRREHSVGELADALSVSISSVSQHLRALKDQGLVEYRKEAQTVFYRFQNAQLMEGCHLMRKALLEESAQQEQLQATPEKAAV